MKTHILILQLVCIFCIASCGQKLRAPATSDESLEEIVNGLSVQWPKHIDEGKKSAIRDLLNNMVYVQGGTFMMGATDEQIPFAKKSVRGNEFPAHYVHLDDFWISSYKVSYQLVNALHDKNFKFDVSVEYGWEDWRLVLYELREMTGLEIDFPTEAQWEYAARGGNKSMGYIYPGSNDKSKIWHRYNDKSGTESIPNELGLFDLADKREEWCKDRYAEYDDTPYVQNNPLVSYGVGHVTRGGGHYSTPSRVSERSYCRESDPTYFSHSIRPVINLKNK